MPPTAAIAPSSAGRPAPAALPVHVAELADEPDDREPRRRRRDRNRLEPHRGQLIMILGLVSFVMAPLILGPTAWIMATGDLRKMDAGQMDRAGRDQTQIGRICGMLSTLLCVLVIFALCGRVVYIVAHANWENRQARRGGAAQRAQVDPNAPDPNEGPAPAGWTVLFRSDDPSVWNTNSPGRNFAVPVRRAHSKIRYLRLRRMDTREQLIVPITHRQLTRDDRPESSPGHWWNGTASDQWGARHLGIVQVPAASGDERGLVALAHVDGGACSGSGFGWKTHVDDRQYFCWQGKEIARTVFEVAVTADRLTEAEKRWLTIQDRNEAAPQGWTVLFRSDDPGIWNNFSSGANFAMPVGRAHPRVRHLRLKRMDSGEAVIMPIRWADLAREPKKRPDRGFAWNGSSRLQYKARHLGIARAPRFRWPGGLDGVCSVVDDGFDAFSGWGFAHKCNVGDQQYYCWQGKEIPRTAFEIAVKVDNLSAEERLQIVTRFRAR
jgi:hypothetical protein